MKIRVAVLSALLVAGTVAASAHAGPSLCFQIKDDTGDVTLPSDSMDIVTADIGASAKSITAVIRPKKLPGSSGDSTAPTGYAYNFRFTAPGVDTPLYFLASVQPTGTTFEFGYVTGSFLNKAGEAKGVFDEGRGEVRMTAPIAFGGLAKLTPGTKLGNLQAITQRRFVVLLSGADSTTIDEKKTYTVGADTCVVHG